MRKGKSKKRAKEEEVKMGERECPGPTRGETVFR